MTHPRAEKHFPGQDMGIQKFNKKGKKNDIYKGNERKEKRGADMRTLRTTP
jgi:hypothetical protein